MIYLGNRKHCLSVSLELVLLGKTPEGYTEFSKRENFEILANLGQHIYRKIIPSRLGGGGGRKQVKTQVLSVHCQAVGRKSDAPQRPKATVGRNWRGSPGKVEKGASPRSSFPCSPQGHTRRMAICRCRETSKMTPVSKDVTEEQPLRHQRKKVLDVGNTRLGMAGGKWDPFASA